MHKGYYTTLEQRLIGIYPKVWEYRLATKHSDLLSEFFSSGDIKLTIHLDNGRVLYEIQHASSKGNLFLPPYNPLVVYRSNILVAVIYLDYYFAVSEDSYKVLWPAFVKMENPSNFFKKSLEIWGRCSSYSSKISPRSSLEDDMDLICYSNVSSLTNWLNIYCERKTYYKIEEGDPTDNLNPIERKNIEELNSKLEELKAYAIKDDGFNYNFDFVPIVSLTLVKYKHTIRGLTDNDSAKLKSVVNFLSTTIPITISRVDGSIVFSPATKLIDKIKKLGINIVIDN